MPYRIPDKPPEIKEPHEPIDPGTIFAILIILFACFASSLILSCITGSIIAGLITFFGGLAMSIDMRKGMIKMDKIEWERRKRARKRSRIWWRLKARKQ